MKTLIAGLVCHSLRGVKLHPVTVFPSKAKLPKTDQLAWKIAQVAADNVAVDPDVTEMVINRVIDNASVAIAAINRTPVANARSQALAHPRDGEQWRDVVAGMRVVRGEKRVVHVELAHGGAVGPRGPFGLERLSRGDAEQRGAVLARVRQGLGTRVGDG